MNPTLDWKRRKDKAIRTLSEKLTLKDLLSLMQTLTRWVLKSNKGMSLLRLLLIMKFLNQPLTRSNYNLRSKKISIWPNRLLTKCQYLAAMDHQSNKSRKTNCPRLLKPSLRKLEIKTRLETQPTCLELLAIVEVKVHFLTGRVLDKFPIHQGLKEKKDNMLQVLPKVHTIETPVLETSKAKVHLLKKEKTLTTLRWWSHQWTLLKVASHKIQVHNEF